MTQVEDVGAEGRAHLVLNMRVAGPQLNPSNVAAAASFHLQFFAMSHPANQLLKQHPVELAPDPHSIG